MRNDGYDRPSEYGEPGLGGRTKVLDGPPETVLSTEGKRTRLAVLAGGTGRRRWSRGQSATADDVLLFHGPRVMVERLTVGPIKDRFHRTGITYAGGPQPRRIHLDDIAVEER